MVKWFSSSSIFVSHWFIDPSLGPQTHESYHNLDLKSCPVSGVSNPSGLEQVIKEIVQMLKLSFETKLILWS